ncbi:MAG: DUF29 domain-containing protein [Aquificaceae bacterium]|nr:DUF29 domain-containing protein [Aquificaceae bacterium]
MTQKATKKLYDKDALKKLYDKDFPLWAEVNLMLLKEKAYEQVDWENLFEEIEDMARSDLKACISYLAVILEHLYKLEHFKNLAGGETAGSGWIKSILTARERLKRLLNKHPSLKQKLPDNLQEAWEDAVSELRVWLIQNGYDPDQFEFPKDCPYTYKDTLTNHTKT